MRILLCLMGLLFGAWTTQAAERPPNIILFVVDDLGWSDPGFMGNPWHETPAMDQLAQEGAVFTQAYAPAPACRPSRASLLTGLYPTRHQIYSVFNLDLGPKNQQRAIASTNRQQLWQDFPTLAYRLGKQGYTTALIGKWDLGSGNASPQAHGFQYSLGSFQSGTLPAGFFPPYELPGLETTNENEYLTDRLGREAEAFIRSHKEKPFFLMLSHYAIHLPFEAPDDTIRHFRNKPKPDRRYNSTYAAMLRHVDDSLLAIRHTLNQQGLSENTLIILTSDNGSIPDYLGPPTRLRGGKSSFLENGIRIPLVMYWPEQIPAQRIETPVSLIDISPTVLKTTHLAEHPASDGENLWPCLKHGQCPKERTLFWHFPGYLPDTLSTDFFSVRPQSLLRFGDWKLIENLETGNIALFNITEDPEELHDLSIKEPVITATLIKRLKIWQTDMSAPIPTANPNYQKLRGWHRLQEQWLFKVKKFITWIHFQWIRFRSS